MSHDKILKMLVEKTCKNVVYENGIVLSLLFSGGVEKIMCTVGTICATASWAVHVIITQSRWA